tara:strand:+ start:237 stop:614 length:378 start_codon:yes stop_codon:yes gene_type:complete
VFLRHNALGIAWAFFVLLLCALPGGQFQEARHEHLDKIIHIILFGLLFVLLTVGFIKQQNFAFLRSNVKFKVWIGCVCYGVLIELMQGTIFIDRSIEVSDMLANMVGATIGLGAFLTIYGRESYS